MESEKVKAIKKVLEDLDMICYEKTCSDKINKISKYINELESENERLKHLREVDNTTMTTLRKSNTELNECMDEMQGRIAELEKENEELLNSVETVQNNRCTTKCELTEKQLKQFAERLKEKGFILGAYKGVLVKDIDETLKEFIK